MKIASIAVATLALSACVNDRPAPLPGPAQPGPARLCEAGPAQALLGRPATPALVDQARRQSGATLARRITPEMRVTMEFRADRVNVWVGLTGEAERINCG